MYNSGTFSTVSNASPQNGMQTSLSFKGTEVSKGNIRVAIRVRPLQTSEIEHEESVSVLGVCLLLLVVVVIMSSLTDRARHKGLQYFIKKRQQYAHAAVF